MQLFGKLAAACPGKMGETPTMKPEAQMPETSPIGPVSDRNLMSEMLMEDRTVLWIAD
jgi:hypothetical protein